jgi:putative phage-type endonuclease
MTAPALAAPALPVQGTEAWLAFRRNGIGSSDIAVIAGESPFRSPYSLWAEKTGQVIPDPSDEQAELFEIGHLMEPVLLELYERRTGRHPKRAHMVRVHRDLPWAFASLDAIAPVRRVVEAKWTHSGRWGDAGVPDDVLIQVQWQLFVTGWDVADVVALKAQRPRIVEVPRDQGVIDELVALATGFWRLVETRTPPATDGSEATRHTLVALHPVATAPALAPTPDVVQLVAALVEAKAQAKAAAELEGSVGNALRAVIGDADGIAGYCTYRRNADSTRTNWPAVAAAYRSTIEQIRTFSESPAEADELLANLDLDAIEASHSETVGGARVLRLVSQKGAFE